MDLNKPIEQYELVFLDLETTGLNAVIGDAICEIGALKTRERKITDKFHSLVNPKKNIPEEAFRVHKISDSDVKFAPPFEKIADKLIAFVRESVVCAYNVEFDMGFINHHLRALDCAPLEIPAVDILSMARDVLKLGRYNLESVAQNLAVDTGVTMHRALEDAFIAYRVFFKLLDTFKAKGIVTLEDFISLYGFSNEALKIRQYRQLDIINEAISRSGPVRLKYFSPAALLEEETVMPLRVFQENRFYYLLYQDISQSQASCRIRSNRILAIESV